MDRLKKQVKKLTDNFDVVKSDMDNIKFNQKIKDSNINFDKNIKK